MAGKDTIIPMKRRDLKRLYIIHKAMDGSITQKEAASLLSISERQTRRIIKRVKKEGDQGITIVYKVDPQTEPSPVNSKNYCTFSSLYNKKAGYYMAMLLHQS